MDPINFTSGRSTDAAKQALAAAITLVDPNYVSKTLLPESGWRANYYHHFVKANSVMLTSPEIAISSAKAGLQSLRTTFQKGEILLADVEGRVPCTSPLGTKTIHGKGQETSYSCPMNGKDHDLTSLTQEMERLVKLGAAEPSALHSIEKLAKNKGACLTKGALSKYTFAILGAGSQMGPCRQLLKMGATVLAVDLKGREEMWNNLTNYAETTCGTLVCPLSENNVRGCDILTDFEAISRWIIECSIGKRIVIGSFLYADGGLFVRIAVAADALIKAVCKVRKDTALINLCTPTAVFVVPKEANAEATRRYNELSIHTPWKRAVETLSNNRYLEQNAPMKIVADNGDEFLLQDSQVWQQGPNYAFAKLIQRWRNIVARDNGHWVSSNVAPASLTVSVMHNKIIRAGMLGCQFFGIIPFEPETSNTLMTALAIHDLNDPSSAANPSTVLRNPLELFVHNSVHGGTWRCAYVTNSYTEVSAVLYGLKIAMPYVAGIGIGSYGLSKL